MNIVHSLKGAVVVLCNKIIFFMSIIITGSSMYVQQQSEIMPKHNCMPIAITTSHSTVVITAASLLHIQPVHIAVLVTYY